MHDALRKKEVGTLSSVPASRRLPRDESRLDQAMFKLQSKSKLNFTLALFLVSISAGHSDGQAAVSAKTESEIREGALAAKAPRRTQFLYSLSITYLPSCHPEARIIVYYKQAENADVEVIQATTSASNIIGHLRTSSHPINVADAIAMMGVKRTHFSVDSDTARSWLSSFQLTAARAIQHPSVPTLVRLDGTLYQARFSGSVDADFSVAGAEIGTASADDPEMVSWMNGFLNEVLKFERRRTK
jgi:hypothetical protein